MNMNEFGAMPQPKHSLEAEQSVLAGLLSDGEKAYDAIGGLLSEESFYEPAHKLIWAAAEKLVNAGKSLDFVELTSVLAGQVELSYLHSVSCAYTSIHGLPRHARLVAVLAKDRQLQSVAADVRVIAADEDSTVEQRVASAVQALEGVLSEREQSQPLPVSEFVVNLIDELQDLADGKVKLGRETGIPTLDGMLSGGFYDGQLIVIAARPSVGKSSFAQQLCLTQARRGVPTAFLGMEMTQKELTRRTIANLGAVSLRGLKTGQLSGDDFARVADGIEHTRRLPMYLDFCPGATLAEISTKARTLVRKHGIKLLVVDYLQLMKGSNERQERRTQLEEVTRGLKRLAGQLGITVALLSQLNRSVEARANPRPIMSDLKECGAIEEDADVILALWDHRKGEDGQPSIKGLAAIKARDAEKSEVALHFEGQYQRWTESTESLNAPIQKVQSRTNRGFE